MLKIIVHILQVICAIALISTVLLQSGKSAGLSGSIAGAGETVFGGKKKGLDDLLSKLTAYIAVLFVILTLSLGIIK